ncbi:unnamed protein product [Vitrella brassicaformis CCMP3155]|uniref:Uncharacterized protein n=1 Tax=Vitrella brassicaformis (strain CCMP3155) TaxID=1169540 RepID=A0A0G4FSG7_VITBC|nr:unnamed protein product [Vitrella brassicaformis CCMP3155]|eukprot:CEM17367.1 unnamed protein product [Vitrella brassicaformis CCMP3155]
MLLLAFAGQQIGQTDLLPAVCIVKAYLATNPACADAAEDGNGVATHCEPSRTRAPSLTTDRPSLILTICTSSIGRTSPQPILLFAGPSKNKILEHFFAALTSPSSSMPVGSSTRGPDDSSSGLVLTGGRHRFVSGEITLTKCVLRS